MIMSVQNDFVKPDTAQFLHSASSVKCINFVYSHIVLLCMHLEFIDEIFHACLSLLGSVYQFRVYRSVAEHRYEPCPRRLKLKEMRLCLSSHWASGCSPNDGCSTSTTTTTVKCHSFRLIRCKRTPGNEAHWRQSLWRTRRCSDTQRYMVNACCCCRHWSRRDAVDNKNQKADY